MNAVEQSLLYGIAVVTIVATLIFFVVQYFRNDD